METDLSLITRIKEENDSSSLLELIDRHSGIYVEMVNKTVSDSCDFINKKDILLDKDYSIYAAAIKYKPDKNTKFSTYLAHSTRWKCLNLYNKKRKMLEEPLDDTFKEKCASGDFIVDIESKEIIKKVLKLAATHPDKRVKKILDMRYAFGYNKTHTWKEISEEIDMTIPGCIDIHNKFISKIKNKIK
jgi:RNA polymerase sigma factor (sigma-70 family)